jgi:hypothetical protein
MVVGLPGRHGGASLIKLVIKEPPRGHSEAPASPGLAEDVSPERRPKPPFSLANDSREMGRSSRSCSASGRCST